MCFKPIPDLIQELNRNLQGWANYFRFGYPSDAYRNLNYYVQQRLRIHLHRRSQRPYRAPEGVSLYAHFRQLGLRYSVCAAPFWSIVYVRAGCGKSARPVRRGASALAHWPTLLFLSRNIALSIRSNFSDIRRLFD